MRALGRRIMVGQTQGVYGKRRCPYLGHERTRGVLLA